MRMPSPEVAPGLRAGARFIVDGPTVVTRYRAWEAAGGQGIDPTEALDAANECDHERLPGDRTPPCGCFPGLEPDPIPEPVPVPVEEPMPQPRKPAKPRRRATRVTAKAGAKANADFVAQMVTQFDAEIERRIAANPKLAKLVAARDALKKVA